MDLGIPPIHYYVVSTGGGLRDDESLLPTRVPVAGHDRCLELAAPAAHTRTRKGYGSPDRRSEVDRIRCLRDVTALDLIGPLQVLRGVEAPYRVTVLEAAATANT